MVSRPGAPHLADATDLENWAQRIDARYQLGHLLRRLIRADNDQVYRLDMRSGEGAGIEGYDGIVEAGRSTPLVPEGLSVWELGSGGDPRKKANSDYRSRTDNSLDVDKAATTFVFVTLRRWDEKVEWSNKKRAEGIWRDVLAFDADDLEQALDEAPNVHYWISERLGLSASDVQTLEDWWGRFSAVYQPLLTPQMVLAGREDAAAGLLRLLARDVGKTFVRAASVDDGLAFVAATVLAAEEETSQALLSKALLVYDAHSLRRLDQTSSLLMLLPYDEELRRQADLVRSHHMVCIVTDEGDADLVLPAIPHVPFEALLVEAGVSTDEAQRLSRAAHKSLVALRRVATPGSLQPDNWSRELAERSVRRAWLVGSWNSARSADRDVLERVTGLTYDALDDSLRRIAAEPDPLFTVVGSSWAATPRLDAWPTARFAIAEADLKALEASVQTVLSAVDPRLDMPLEERWTAALHGKMLVHSPDLRSGLARTLALLGARGDDVRLDSGRTGRLWAEVATGQLLLRANADDTGQLWHSLQDVAPLLAEAAPDVFLRALREACTGEDPVGRSFFQDSRETDALGISSPHTGFLWALEGLAWSATFLALVVDVLALLCELDPGGRLSNRPFASLESIFRPWLPQTTATPETRMRILDGLSERHPEVAWDLMISMLPESHAVGMYSHRPDFRSWAEGERKVTREEYRITVTEISDRLVEAAGADEEHWRKLLSEFDRLHPGAQSKAIAALRDLDPLALGQESGEEVWSVATQFVRRHRQFPDAEWSLPETTLQALEAAVSHLAPESPLRSSLWLFEGWMPDIGVPRGDDVRAYEAEVLRLRQQAIRNALDVEGLGAVCHFASTVEMPWAVGQALGSLGDDETDGTVVELLGDENPKVRRFADAYVGARASGDDGWVMARLEYAEGRPDIQARLLLRVSDLREAWNQAGRLGAAVDEIYWAEFSPYGRGADFPEVSEAASRLIDHGRAAMALDLLSMYARPDAESLDLAVVQRALDAFGSRRDDPELRNVSDYDVSRLLGVLRARGVSDDVVARYEWKFLPLLAREGRLTSLERTLASNPREFVNLVELVYRPASSKGEEPEPRSEERSAVAGQAWRLLHEWHTVPGTTESGSVDRARLFTWLTEARVLLAASDRQEVGELQIGEVLAHAPRDADGVFPASAVRDALEAAPDERLGRGFAVGVHNKRGVTSRGLTEGGEQEYQLARQFYDWATAVGDTHPRTAAILRSIADSYMDEGRRNDEEARRYLEGLDT
jgi:hypothetical protein